MRSTMGYYNDDSKLTFDEADQIVDRFIEHHSDTRNTVSCRGVAVAMDFEDTYHNVIRISEALDERCEVSRERGTKATLYKLP